MRRWTCLLLALLLAAVPALACADAMFDELCGLLKQAVGAPDQSYALYGEALDTVDAVAAGTMGLDEAVPKLTALSAALRALSPAPLAPSEALLRYMQGRGLSMEDYRAVGTGAVLTSGYYADNVDIFLSMWAQFPDYPQLDTTLNRVGLGYERRMDYVAINTLLLPANDAERETVQRLVVDAVPFLTEANLPWESDEAVLNAKYDALEQAYTDMLDDVSINIDQQEAELDGMLK